VEVVPVPVLREAVNSGFHELLTIVNADNTPEELFIVCVVVGLVLCPSHGPSRSSLLVEVLDNNAVAAKPKFVTVIAPGLTRYCMAR
jgi:hypothetical protein